MLVASRYFDIKCFKKLWNTLIQTFDILQVQRGLGVAFPYVLVLSLAAMLAYVIFSAVSFAVATKTNLWNMGTNYLKENLPIFSTEQGDTSTFANRMMTDYLAPYIIPLIHNFPQMYEGEEDLE